MNARNASEALVTPVLGFGGFCFWRDSGVCWSVCVVAIDSYQASMAVKMFPHSIYFVK
jgi:hypothetical protein